MSSSARLSGTLRPTKSPEGNPPNVARAPISSFFSHSHRCIGASTISLLPLPQCSESLSFGFARSRRTVAQGPQSLAAFLSQRRVSPPFFFLRLNIPWRNWAQIHTSRKRIWRCARCVSIWNYNILLLLPFYFSVWICSFKFRPSSRNVRLACSAKRSKKFKRPLWNRRETFSNRWGERRKEKLGKSCFSLFF